MEVTVNGERWKERRKEGLYKYQELTFNFDNILFCIHHVVNPFRVTPADTLLILMIGRTKKKKKWSCVLLRGWGKGRTDRRVAMTTVVEKRQMDWRYDGMGEEKAREKKKKRGSKEESKIEKGRNWKNYNQSINQCPKKKRKGKKKRTNQLQPERDSHWWRLIVDCR
jgi:hypothetical protein